MDWYWTILIIAVISGLSMRGLHIYFDRHPLAVDIQGNLVFVAGDYSPVLTFMAQRTSKMRIKPIINSKNLIVMAELLVIFAWAGFAGQNYLDFNLSKWPAGYEYSISVRENYFWPQLLRCGTCALWNGFSDGGYPALVDLQGNPLHPLVAIPAIFFGVVNGSKITIILALALAGLAQWWIGRILELGRTARMWGAMLAVVAGFLAGRMDNGLITLLVSTASASLVIPAGIRLAQQPSNKACVRLAIALTLTAIAGQGYLQLCTAFAILPAFVILFGKKKEVWRKFFLAMGLAVLLAGVFVVPYLHNASNWIKDTDPDLKSVQPLEYQLLNLVIRNPDFYRNDTLEKLPYPYLYVNYIGWIPLLLAGIGLKLIPREKIRLLAFFLTGIALVFLNSSMILPKLILGAFDKDFLYGIRFGPLMVGLSAPLIIGLAAWGLNLILARKEPILNIHATGFEINVRLWWFLLAIPCLWALASALDFSRDWMYTIDSPPECPRIMDQLKILPTQWIGMAEGEHYWDICAQDAGVKLAQTFHPWHWKSRILPLPSLAADRPDQTKTFTQVVFKNADIVLHTVPGNNYVQINSGGKTLTPCAAYATGGLIQVLCNSNVAGQLVVAEHNWSGWTAFIDGKPIGLIPGEWLQINFPTGQHRVNFVYQPWDVPVGLLFSMLGIILAIWLYSGRILTRPIVTHSNTPLN